jgi:hypothetical protein
VATTEEVGIVITAKDLAGTVFSKVQRGISSLAGGAIGAFKGITKAVFSFQGALLGIGAALTARGIADLITDTADAADNLRDLGRQTGASTEFLSEIQFAAGQAGASIEGLEIGFRTLQKGIGEFVRDGKGPVAELAGSLSSEFEDLVRSGAPVEDVFIAVAREIKNLSASEKVFVTSKLFGKAGAGLIPLLSEDLDALRAKARELGITLSGEAAAGADKFNDTIGELKGAIQGLKNQVILPLLPEITKLIKGVTDELVANRPAILRFFADIIEKAGEFATVIGKALEGIRSAYNFLNTVDNAILFKNATEAVEDLEEQLRKATEGAAFYYRTGGALAKERYEKERAEVEKLTPKLAAARAELEKVTDAYRDLKEATRKQGALSTGGVEAGAKAVGKAIRGIADGIEGIKKSAKETDAANPLAALERGLVSIVDLTNKAAEAQEEADREYAAGFEERGEIISDRFAEDFKLIDEAEKRTEDYRKAIADQRREEFDAIQETQRAYLDKAEAIRKLQDPLRGAIDAVEELRLRSLEWGAVTGDVIRGTSDILSSELAQGFDEVIEKEKGAGEAAKDFAKDALRGVRQLILQLLILKAVQAGIGGIGGLIGGPAAGGVALGKGGIVGGSLEPAIPGRFPALRGADRGGIAMQEGLFRLRERGQNEAVVPLPDNRSIPVRFENGPSPGRSGPMVFSPSITVNLTSKNDRTREDAKFIAQVVLQEMQSSFKFREGLER